jgi:hypothetical protein
MVLLMVINDLIVMFYHFHVYACAATAVRGAMLIMTYMVDSSARFIS